MAHKRENFVGAWQLIDWRIEENEIVHAVTMSLNPDMTGTDQRRLATFDSLCDLTLSAKERMKNGDSRHHILQWKLLE